VAPAPVPSEPPAEVVRIAEQVASSQPSGRCVKSFRGAVLYDRATLEVVGAGFNSPPPPLACTGTARCREVCRHVCVHAEERAIDQALLRVGRGSAPGLYERRVDEWHLDLVHVKVEGSGRVVPSGSPSCGRCSKRVLDVRVVAGVWLYEESSVEAAFADLVGAAVADLMPPIADESVLRRAADAAVKHGAVEARRQLLASWHYYPALEFHRRSLVAEGWAELGAST
jgi:hypothetical protein